MVFPGGKGRQYARIIGLMPPHDVYIEPFAGSGVVARHKRTAKRTILIDRDTRVAERLNTWAPKDWEIRCEDALGFLATFSFSGRELLYCDPPYVSSTRRARRPIYRHEFSDDEHRRLLQILRSVPCKVVLSGYHSQLYSTALATWKSVSFSVRTRPGPATECIWFNFAPPSRLHDDRYIGDSFRERQDVQRRLERIRRRLSGLSAQEQFVIHRWLAEHLQEDRR